MKLRDFPIWLKGGIIGLTVGLLTLLGGYLYELWFEYTRQELVRAAVIETPHPLWIVMFSPFIIAAIISVIFGLGGASSIFELPYANLLIFIFGLIIYFLIGAFVGWIIGKIKKRR